MNIHYLQWAILLLITTGSVMALSVSDVSFDTQYNYLWRGLNHTVSANIENETSSLIRYAVNGVYTDVFNLPLWSYLLNSTHVEGITHNVTHNYDLKNAKLYLTERIEHIHQSHLISADYVLDMEDLEDQDLDTLFTFGNIASTGATIIFESFNTTDNYEYITFNYRLSNESFEILHTYYEEIPSQCKNQQNGSILYDQNEEYHYIIYCRDSLSYRLVTEIITSDAGIILISEPKLTQVFNPRTNFTDFESVRFYGYEDYIEVSNDEEIFGNSNSQTISLWFQPITKTHSSSTYLVSHPATTGNRVYLIHNSNGGIQATIGGQTRTICNLNDYSTDSMNHVVLIRHRDTNTMTGYCNNILKIDNLSATITSNQSMPIYIGNINDNLNYWFNGYMNNVLIYDKALSSIEVSNIYSSGSTNITPVGGAILQLRAQHHNNTHLLDHHYLVQDDERTSYSLNPTLRNQSITSSYNLDFNEDLTLSMWTKRTSIWGDSSTIRFPFEEFTTYHGSEVQFAQRHGYRLYFRLAANGQGVICDFDHTNINEWYHVVLVWNKWNGTEHKFECYTNNVLTHDTSYLTQKTANNTFIIGRTNTSVSPPFYPFDISNVQIFNKTLTSEEVNLLYAGNNQYYGMSASRGDNITTTVYATNLTNTASSSVTEELTTLWVNVTAKDMISTNLISNFTSNISDQYGNTHQYTTTTGNYTAIFNQPSNITSNIYSTGYATNIGTIITTNLLTNPSYDLQHELYETNTAFIYLRDEATNLIITEMINVSIMGDSYSQDFNTSTGILQVTLNPGNYIITASGGVYESRTYNIEIVDNESVIISVYLSRNAETTTFTFVDDFTNQVIEGVSFTISRLINNVWTVVQTKESDISGKTTFTYTPNVRYFFTAQKTSYEDKTFELNPILFSQYDVRMQRSAMDDYQDESTGINIYISPSQFREAQNNYFIIQIYSPGGRLNNYNYNITYPGGSNAGSGTNAYGGMFTHTFNITSATIHDRVVLRYTYTAGGETFTKTKSWTIIQARSKGTGFMNLEDPTFGLGIATRVLIAVGIMIIVAGVAGMIAGWVPGLVLALLLQSLFMMTGFIEPWVGWLSLVVGFIVVMGVSRSG